MNTQILEDLKTSGATLCYGCKTRSDIESDDCPCDEDDNCTLVEFVGVKLPIENAAIITKFAELIKARTIAELDATNSNNSNHIHLVKQVDTVVAKLGLTQEQAWTEGGSLHAPRICNHIQETLDALAEANNKVASLLGKPQLPTNSNASQAIPEGCVPVPIVPTDEMIECLTYEWDTVGATSMYDNYKAMIEEALKTQKATT